ncbi:MAG TPA: hypothetical protein VJB57_11780 [Dehalococcoidia bacterium]|nr:hypothetical protein [Dehalococcoidia bacterium]
MGLFGPPWYQVPRPAGYVYVKKYKGRGPYQGEVNKAIQYGWRPGDPAIEKVKYSAMGEVWVTVNYTKQ